MTEGSGFVTLTNGSAPDPACSKTYGSSGSGFATLVRRKGILIKVGGQLEAR